MKIKLIALDMDGTALQNDHRSISNRTKEAILSAVSQNIMVVPTSGRIYSVLPSAVTSLSGIDYCVTSNGSVVYSFKEDKVICSNYIPPADALWLLQILPPQVWVEVWCDGKIYITQEQAYRLSENWINPFHRDVLHKIGAQTPGLADFVRETKDGIEKINLPMVPLSVKSKIWDLLTGHSEFSLLDTGAGIEIMHDKVSKAQGLCDLCHHLPSISLQNVLAIGDSENDVEMLQICGTGIAMGNAVDCVKQAANAVTLSNIQDGAAAAIENYALKN